MWFFSLAAFLSTCLHEQCTTMKSDSELHQRRAASVKTVVLQVVSFRIQYLSACFRRGSLWISCKLVGLVELKPPSDWVWLLRLEWLEMVDAILMFKAWNLILVNLQTFDSLKFGDYVRILILEYSRSRGCVSVHFLLVSCSVFSLYSSVSCFTCGSLLLRFVTNFWNVNSTLNGVGCGSCRYKTNGNEWN